MQWRSSYVQWIQRTFIHATYWEVGALVDRERLSPFGSLSSRCWEPVSLLDVRSRCPYHPRQGGR